MTRLYIMCGLAFAGKSTLAKEVAKHTGSRLLSFDDLWIEKESEQSIPKDANGWQEIRQLGKTRILKELNRGNSVVYDDSNVKVKHRDEFRDIAKQAEAEAVVIYLDTPLPTIKAREQKNKVTGARHEVEPANFQTVLQQLEPPLPHENALVFTPDTGLEDFLQHLD